MLLEQYLNNNHYPSKQARVDQLPTTPAILAAVSDTLLRLPYQTTIQQASVRLGLRLGFEDQIAAATTGAEILAVTISPTSHHFERGTTGEMYVLNDHREEEFVVEKDNFPTFEPHFIPKQTMLGAHFKRHDEYQAPLTRIGRVPYMLDLYVLEHEQRTYSGETEREIKADETFKAAFAECVDAFEHTRFYFNWKYCTRGRFYTNSHYLNPQGTEYDKALISPAKPSYVYDLDPLKIAVANAEGHDKLTWAERIKAFDSCTKPRTILGRKALRAYKKARRGLPINYYMELDATASGLQIMAILTGCRETARYCNLINTGQREDLYTHVVEYMNLHLPTEHHVTREEIKNPVMTHFYNSLAGPAEVLNDEQLKAFYIAVDMMFPGAKDVMDTINAFWNSNVTHHDWTLPDGHRAIVPVTTKHDKRIEVDELNHFRFTFRHEKVGPSKKSTSLAPNIVHSIDGYIAREMVRRAPCDMITVHDAFFFPPQHFTAIKSLYRQILAEIADSDLFADILTEIAGQPITIPKTSLAEDILASEYAIS